MGSKRSQKKLSSAEATIRRFYFQLGQRLQPLHFESFAIAVAQRLMPVEDEMARMTRYPTFWLLHAIEAGAVHCQRSSEMAVTEADIQSVLTLYRNFIDPTELYMLDVDGGAARWLMLQERRQFQVQQVLHRNLVSRFLRLWWIDKPMASTDAALRRQCGFSISDWIACCFTIHSSMLRARHPTIEANFFSTIPTDILAGTAASAALEWLCFEPAELAAEFGKYHDMTKPLQAAFAEHAFSRRPLLRFTKGWVVPRVDLLSVAMFSSIYRAAREADGPTLRTELGRSLEKYTHTLTGRWPGLLASIPTAEIKRRASGLSCDGILEFEKSVVLFECKAVQQTARLLFPEVLQDTTNPFTHIAKGFEQVHATARDLKCGRYDNLLGPGLLSKPVFGLVVTYGHFAQANHPWTRARLIEHHISAQGSEHGTWPHPLSLVPQVFDLPALEKATTWLNANKVDPGELLAKCPPLRPTQRCDWNQFFDAELADRSDPMRQFFRQPFDQFWKQVFEPHLGLAPFRD